MTPAPRPLPPGVASLPGRSGSENRSALGKRHPDYPFWVGLYNVIQKWAPLLHHPIGGSWKGSVTLQRNRVKLGKRYYESLLREFAPHLILSVHDFLNRGYFQTAKSILGHRVRCSTYCGEFSGGFGYSRNWVEPTVDLFFSRTSMAQDYAVRMGISPQKCRVRGHLMHPKVYDQILDHGARGGIFWSTISGYPRANLPSCWPQVGWAPTTT